MPHKFCAFLLLTVNHEGSFCENEISDSAVNAARKKLSTPTISRRKECCLELCSDFFSDIHIYCSFSFSAANWIFCKTLACRKNALRYLKLIKLLSLVLTQGAFYLNLLMKVHFYRVVWWRNRVCKNIVCFFYRITKLRVHFSRS